MAAYEFEQATMTLQFEVGRSAEGKKLYKAASYRNIEAAATPAQLAAVASALASLTVYPLAAITRLDKQRIQQ
ncbi:DUF1659 domain-containing protein [Metasolibacillus sp.]|uniref:DUF1659 domain-containing protein n=1 Tax=Metasolibacillus sp. TaxID=2703680 RepID=UPI0025DCA9EE|nr:DUF1659 domain-containing protein [Metasolibacillus sp.]MCT6922925.1 DUF1659 domain-containing protein [Metasolibacillus sp.]MCT6939163.1 DUF1659 domain-containing protein [Metasolibacillus sp.]